MLEIITGGALSTVQDAGRFGSMKNGFTQSGVMDPHAAKTANALLKNDPGAPVIEMTMKGLTAWFTSETFFCLSGGVFKAKLNDMPVNNNTVYKADKNDRIDTERKDGKILWNGWLSRRGGHGPDGRPRLPDRKVHRLVLHGEEEKRGIE